MKYNPCANLLYVFNLFFCFSSMFIFFSWKFSDKNTKKVYRFFIIIIGIGILSSSFCRIC